MKNKMKNKDKLSMIFMILFLTYISRKYSSLSLGFVITDREKE